MPAERVPLERWRMPTGAALRGEIYASGRPPFAPYPSVTNLLNAYLCPVAVIHDLLHGDSGALLGPYDKRERGWGELFNRYVSYLKHRVGLGELVLPNVGRVREGVLRNDFFEFARAGHYNENESRGFWERIGSPWAERKFQAGELTNSGPGALSYFEISVANPKTPFQSGEGTTRYPAQGRIDEVDIGRRRLVERTIKETGTDTPPQLKDLEIWLYWRIISSLPKEHLPSAWRGVEFGNFELVVETPTRDYIIPSTNAEFERCIQWAYAWINDISRYENPRVLGEAYREEACNPLAPNVGCGHLWARCFHSSRTFPRSRPEIQRAFLPWYRYLLWERMWDADLWWYRTTMLPVAELATRGIVTAGRVAAREGSRVELELQAENRPLARGFDKYTLVLFGTLLCGKRVTSRYEGETDGLIVLTIQDDDTRGTRSALLLPASDDANPLLQSPMERLIASQQRGLLRIQLSGTSKQELATSQSMIQLLDSVFGSRRLRGKRP